jgi:hypothetical protein
MVLVVRVPTAGLAENVGADGVMFSEIAIPRLFVLSLLPVVVSSVCEALVAVVCD